jgi:hypothetical protein
MLLKTLDALAIFFMIMAAYELYIEDSQEMLISLVFASFCQITSLNLRTK